MQYFDSIMLWLRGAFYTTLHVCEHPTPIFRVGIALGRNMGVLKTLPASSHDEHILRHLRTSHSDSSIRRAKVLPYFMLIERETHFTIAPKRATDILSYSYPIAKNKNTGTHDWVYHVYYHRPKKDGDFHVHHHCPQPPALLPSLQHVFLCVCQAKLPWRRTRPCR